jgi:hypothetical protein
MLLQGAMADDKTIRPKEDAGAASRLKVGDRIDTYWEFEQEGGHVINDYLPARVVRQVGFAGVMQYKMDDFKCSGRQYAIQYKEDVEASRERTVVIGASMYLYDEHEKLAMFWRPSELPVEEWETALLPSDKQPAERTSSSGGVEKGRRKRRVKLGGLDSDSSSGEDASIIQTDLA